MNYDRARHVNSAFNAFILSRRNTYRPRLLPNYYVATNVEREEH